MKFIKLTGYKCGNTTWINPSYIRYIDINTDDKTPVTCVYIDESNSVGVLETPEEILELLK